MRADPGYGALSHRGLDAMDQGEGIEGSDRKQDPLDFALWKAEKPGEDTAWDAPWGRGRPGWHIECSAMAEKLLGVGFEVHGGGNDLVFPHHENEAAQTRAARDGELARIWMHNGMLQAGDEKMAKSVGNIAGLPDVIDRWGRDALVMLFVSGHYRQPLAFREDTMAQAQANVRKLGELGPRLEPGPSPAWSAALLERFLDALAEDFTTPEALAVVWAWVREANRSSERVGQDDLRTMLHLLGLEGVLDVAGAPAEVLELADQRVRAREQRDFAEADRLRDAIAAAGWSVRDVSGGFELVPAG